MKDYFSNNSYLSFFIKRGVLFQKFRTEALTWDVFQRSIEDRARMINGSFYPAIIDLRDLHKIERSVRQVIGSSRALHGLKACALLVDTPVTRFLGELIVVEKAKNIPARIFYNEEEAIKWLQNV